MSAPRILLCVTVVLTYVGAFYGAALDDKALMALGAMPGLIGTSALWRVLRA